MLIDKYIYTKHLVCCIVQLDFKKKTIIIIKKVFIMKIFLHTNRFDVEMNFWTDLKFQCFLVF